MRRRLARVFAGILAVMLMLTSGSATAFAGVNPRYATTKVIDTGDPGDPKTPDPSGTDGDTQENTNSGETVPGESAPKEDSEDNQPGQQAPDSTDPADMDSTNTDAANTDPINSDAANTDPANTNPTDTNQPEINTGNSMPENQPEDNGPKKAVKGSVEVRIVSGIEILSASTAFTVQLVPKGGSAVTRELILPAREGEEAPRTSVRFPELEEGSYSLRISGDQFLPFEQEITVGKLGYRVQVYTGSLPNTEGGAKPGLMIYGDVNRNGKLDDEDESAIVDAIESNPQDSDCDLNRDGVVDLLDLNYFTTMKGAKAQASSLEALIPLEALNVGMDAGTEVQRGSLEALLSGENGGAAFMPVGGGAISSDNPVVIDFDFSASEQVGLGGIVVESPRNSENVIEKGQVLIRYEQDGQEKYEFVDFQAPSNLRMVSAASPEKNDGFRVSWDKNGALCVDLGGQIAIKHVTFKITKTANSLNLAEISRVEFLNDMESRIPEPSADIPVGFKAVAGNKTITVSWNRANNVTGYEVAITSDGKTEFRKTTATTLIINQFAKDKLVNGTEYTVCVRSTNGEWKSGYSPEEKVVPKVDAKPSAPDNVSAKGGYRTIDVRWTKAKDADGYNVYWQEEGDSQFQKITGIEGLYYQISGLKDNTRYLVYVTAVNEMGESAQSKTASDKTISGLIDAKLPAYRLINTSNGSSVLSSHVKAASIGGGGFMVDSPLDTEKNSALGLFDNNYASYMQREDWDYGGAYPGGDKGITAELDNVYDLGMIAFAEPLDLGDYMYFSVQYWDENGTKQTAKNTTLLKKRSNNRNYYILKFQDPVRTSKVQLGMGRYNGGLRKVTVSEIRFYEYDSIEREIMELYGDDLHIFLREDVTAETIDELERRLDTKDPVSGEYHPLRETLKKELETARELLETGGLGGVLEVNPSITAKKDEGISVGGLNAWQPLGVTAAAGDELVVYVGHPGKKEGAGTDLSLIFTQQHGETGSLSSSVSLKIGRNEIIVPKISSTDKKEKGGALYIQYNGSNEADAYAVRVSGGTAYPVLRLYGVTLEEQSQRIEAYVTELEAYVAELEAKHQELHDGSANENLNVAYNAKECILNLTDIQMDQMMLSLPASQIYAGLKADPKGRLSSTVEAMDGMMTLFYQHKGLTDSFAEGTNSSIIDKNHLPYRYLNIRYMKMFAGAFMYAAGNHIGIEWNEAPGMMGGVPVTAENGKYISGQYYGWGVAHEIGHEINQGAYAHAEVTNNYFSVLAQAKDRNDTVRFQYPEVFKKVTSGTEGYAGNVFTQLGMYWQLHLAYDRDYNFKTYDTYQEIFDHLFFARVDSYARDTSRAPKPGGVALELNGGRDQNLMRLASAAAERDLSEFFIRWGLRPDSASTAYMSQFAPEERAIYYVDDEARVYEIEHGKGEGFLGKQVVTAVSSVSQGQVTLTMSCTGAKELLQGYEITRVFTEEGRERRETAGFTTTNTFTDSVAFAANHVIRYEVTAIDKYMNRSRSCEAGAVKIDGSGLKDKSFWTASTNMLSDEDAKPAGTQESPCESETVSAVRKVIDNDGTTTFTGTLEAGDPYILLELGQSTEVSALQYTLSGGGQAVTDFKIEVSEDGELYREVRNGTFRLSNGSEMIYFNNGKDNWVCTYDAAYVRLTAVGQQGKNISVTELNLYGPSGDNVEFLSAQNGQKAIGKLSSDYQYGKKAEEKIPAGSVVFTGSYKGNPAYNVVVLYDEKGNIVGGTDADGALVAEQVILAEDPGDALLGETSEGTWIYWLPASAKLPDKVRAELYRVDNALTNEGQRMVSDTAFVTVPQTLPEISLGSGR